MKKIKYFGMLLVSLLLITGCGSSDTTELDEALENMQNLKGATLNMTMDMGTDQYTISVETEGDYAEDGSSHTTVTMSLLGIESEVYTVVKDNILYTYTSSGDEWTYTTEEYTSSSELSTVGNYVAKYKSVKKVKSDLDGATKYEVTIDKDTYAQAIAESDEEDALTFENDVVADIYVKDGYVVKMVMDLSDVLSSEDMMGFTTYSITIELSNHNQINPITVPDEVVNNATEYVEETEEE